MSEKDVKRVEDKVNLLYKILLELEVDTIGHPYSRDYILNFMDELIPLFNISVKKEIIKDLPDYKVMGKNLQKITDENLKLKKDLEDGNYLAKDEEKSKRKIKNLTDRIEIYQKIFNVRKNIKDSNTNIYNIRLFEELKNKLRIEEIEEIYDDGYGIHRKSDLENSLKERDDLQKNLNYLRMRLKKAMEKSSDTSNFPPK